MLSEIYDPEFADSVGDHRHIHFHNGLNVIMGGEYAENSIGKSTVLMLIDYSFGARDLSKSGITKSYAVGDHIIYFTFTWDSQNYYFGRDTAEKTKVIEYEDGTFKRQKRELKLTEFHELLFRHYDLPQNQKLKWREAVGPFARISEYTSIQPEKPLMASSRAKDENAVRVLEKLYGVFDQIQDTEAAMKKADKQYKASLADIPLPFRRIRTQRQYHDYQKQYAAKTAEIARLKGEMDDARFQEQLQKSRKGAAIEQQLERLKIQHRALAAAINQINDSLSKTDTPPSVDKSQIEQLAELFPHVNIKKVEEIEHFHQQLGSILQEQFAAQRRNYELAFSAVTEQMDTLRGKLREQNTFSTFDSEQWDHITELVKESEDIAAALRFWDTQKSLKDTIDKSKEALKRKRARNIARILEQINDSLDQLSAAISGPQFTAPALQVQERKNGSQAYELSTERDAGAGTESKALIEFDLTLLAQTALPYTIHDTVLLKNIADTSIDRIVKHYIGMASHNKQVFIAFDKRRSYSQATQAALDHNTVAKLGKGAHALFGRVWNEEPGYTE